MEPSSELGHDIFGIISPILIRRQRVGIGQGKTIFLVKASPASYGHLGYGAPAGKLKRSKRRNIRLGEIAIISGCFFVALMDRGALRLVPAAGFLPPGFAFSQKLGLSFDFKFNSFFYRSKGIDIFYFHLGVEGCAGSGFDHTAIIGKFSFFLKRHISFTAHLPFLHIGITRAQVAENKLKFLAVGLGFG